MESLRAADGLEVTLFASEPMLTNPTNMSIDAHGRIWVTEAVNYRVWRLNDDERFRPEGDRILILEDTTGDGRADSRKVFYQGTDIDAALGITVLENKVIVSRSPDVIVFTDENGNDTPDRKEVRYTGIGGDDHDHGMHAMTFGPDGKLYFNFGDVGEQILTGNGEPITDRSGNRVRAEGKPYRQGMVFRSDVDGSNLDTLAYNFRNPYEVIVDSFGRIWQADNDDDGNRSCRVNFILPYGNYGYTDEVTGAGWRTERIGQHETTHGRHWHQNDPGVVPNLLDYGSGAPTGGALYEGDLLPEPFRNQVLQAESLHGLVFAPNVTPHGAGYEAEMLNLIEPGGDRMFRPSDVVVAPDGSVFVTDWRDSGVGGHLMTAREKGRIYRVAPPEAPYEVPTVDVETPEGAAEALTSPNMATRYLAWQALHEMQKDAESALLALWESDEVRMRARALHLLARIDGRAEHYVNEALQDEDANIRETAVRVAQDVPVDLLDVLNRAVEDPSAHVRREAAIALRWLEASEAADLWARLANQHDSEDRWYLEALGIGAEGRWDRFLEAWLAPDDERWRTPAGRDIVWRSRAEQTPAFLAQIIVDASTSPEQLPRYFRALHFQDAAAVEPILLELAFEQDYADAQRERLVQTAVLRQIDPAVIQDDPAKRAALDERLDELTGMVFVELVERFGLRERQEELFDLVAVSPNTDAAAAAVRLLLTWDAAVVRQRIAESDEQTALELIRTMGHTRQGHGNGLLMEIFPDEQRALAQRHAAVRALVRSHGGATALLETIEDGALASELESAAAGAYLSVPWDDLRTRAAEHLSLPSAEGGEDLSPIDELVERHGDAERGKEVYAAATCLSCHQVNGEGIDFGPDLSEIGDKLGRRELYNAILFPDTGVLMGYEQHTLHLENGSRVAGLLDGETDQTITLRLPGGVTVDYDRSEIVEHDEKATSMMPGDLQRLMSEEDLVHLVEYLTTLQQDGN